MDLDLIALGSSLLLIVIIYTYYRLYQKVNTLYRINRALIETNCTVDKETQKLKEAFDSLSKAQESLINDLEIEVNKNLSLERLYKELKNNYATFKDKVNYQIKDIESTHKLEIKKARKESVDKSRAVMRGQATEHLAPYVMQDINPKDCRFMGNPIDYVVFDGLSDVTDKVTKDIKQVIFVDVKTGKSQLTTVQRRIRDAIKDGRVSFQVINPDKKEKENGDKSIL